MKLGWLKILLLMAVLSLSTLLFVGNPRSFNSKITFQFWESGHFFLFFGFTLVLMNLAKLKRLTQGYRVGMVLVLALFFAFFTEVIQQWVGRTFQLSDILKDMLGAAAGCSALWFIQANNLAKKTLSAFSLITFSLTALNPLIKSVHKEYQLTVNFPMISNAENSDQLQDWWARHGKITRSIEQVRQGNFAFKVDWTPGRYPSFRLKNLYSNWRGYNQFNFSVYNASAEEVQLNYKIFDYFHKGSGQVYGDRFEKSFMIKPGWNDVSQSLTEVLNAPKNRKMEMQNISTLSFYLVNLKTPITVYFDDFYLSE